MKMFKTLTLLATLLAGSALATAPAQAKKKEAAAAQRQLKLSKAEQATAVPLDAAVAAKDWAAATTALAAAQATAQSADARYFVATRQFSIAQGTNNLPMQADAIQKMIGSGGVPAAELPRLYSALGSVAYQAKNYELAGTAFEKLAELEPSNSEHITNVAKIRAQQKRFPEAIAALDRSIASSKAAGQKPSEDTYKLALQYTLDGKLNPQANRLSRELVTAYPSSENWRLALDVYRTTNKLDTAMSIDTLRLIRAAKLMQGNDYLELAENLNERGLPGETKAVLDEGIASRALDSKRPGVKELLSVATGRVAADRASLSGLEAKAMSAANGRIALGTADAYLGYGDYAKAASMYRAALQKGSVDASLANTRLGIALAMAGNKPEAEAAFKAVTGARAELAAYWLQWLQRA